MKILSGKYKGRNFYMPASIRPSQNIIRKAIFDIIGHDLAGLSFLELFSGSGAVGLEAISLGAGEVVMIEKDAKCHSVIEENITLLKLDPYDKDRPKIETYCMDAFVAVKRFSEKKRKFDLVFIDPPFGRELAKKALNLLSRYDILQPNCTVIVEHPKREILPEKAGRFSCFRQKTYGSSVLSLYK